MKKTRMQKGITLIALIITIIILLILAVVTIGSINKNNIITYAQNASSDYNKGKDKEESIIAGYESLIESNLPGYSNIGKIVEKNSTINGKPYSSTNPVIPAGFAAINITGDNASNWDAEDGPEVDKGLVITDNIQKRDNNGNTIGNEFVWVPVYDINKFAKLQEDSMNYRGVLYDWRSNNEYSWPSTGTREPDVIVGQDGESYDAVSSYLEQLAGVTDIVTKDGETPGTINQYDFKEQLQNEFNKMVTSVKKYGGFYVGRYELSLNQRIAQSKAGETPITVGYSWYTMYSYCKTYSKSGVSSEMIWGCQWDEMMRFIGKTKANNTGNVSHIKDDFNSVPYKTGGTDYSTNYKKLQEDENYIPYNDILNNIYDLEGNVKEKTKEAESTASRATRGGSVEGEKNEFPASYRNGGVYLPYKSYDYSGSRLTLYIP